MIEIQRLLHGDPRIEGVFEKSRVLVPGVRVRIPEDIMVEAETLSNFSRDSRILKIPRQWDSHKWGAEQV